MSEERAEPEVGGWDVESLIPPWAQHEIPDPNGYMESECFVAGAISTLPPFDKYHPAYALPIARQALDALGEWTPRDS